MPRHQSTPVMQLRQRPNASAELLIYGDIGDSFAVESVTGAAVARQLASLPDEVSEINVHLNSCGGSVADGLAIYNGLRRHPARKIVTVDGIAASIASVIAMAGDEVRMPPASLMMIHAPWTQSAGGNAAELRGFATQLDAWAATMAEAYASKSGRPVAEMRALLDDGEDHWFTAEEAVDAGFADLVETAANEPAEFPIAASLRDALPRFINRAPARIAASLRALASGETFMPDNAPSPSAASQVSAAQRAEVIAAERHRVQQIRATVRSNPSDQVMARLAEQCIDEGTSFEVFGQRALEVLAAGREPLNAPAGALANPTQSGADFIGAAADALVARAGVQIAKPHAAMRDFMTMDTGELARACLRRSGKDYRQLDRVGAIRAAMTTSDFPTILGNALGKSLRQGFEEDPQSHSLWTRRSLVEDFKSQTRALLSSAPDLLFIPEGGEYKHGALDEDAAQFAVAKYGVQIRLTWEALVNDDLGAFVRIPQAMGAAARRKEADLVYGLFAANDGDGPTMQDGAALFHADHANLTAQVDGLDAVSLSLARTLLRRQKAKGGGVLNLQPRFLIVPAELEMAAEQLLLASTRGLATGADAAMTAGWVGGLQLVVEPRLEPDAFYVAASPNQIDTLEVAGLQADNGVPQVEEQNEFDRDVKAWKVRHVVTAAFTDWRGIVKVPVEA
ncbi:ClpP-like prohead protease/major capsid protein fusion protein [Luteimonas qiangzhengi]|uniref:ClpP-like prohead protease/major capsid protein fusion protein n=1 Tax=Luteimonas sp. MJ146 TaxID=3129240 RepID=UPI0031B9F68F